MSALCDLQCKPWLKGQPSSGKLGRRKPVLGGSPSIPLPRWRNCHSIVILPFSVLPSPVASVITCGSFSLGGKLIQVTIIFRASYKGISSPQPDAKSKSNLPLPWPFREIHLLYKKGEKPTGLVFFPFF